MSARRPACKCSPACAAEAEASMARCAEASINGPRAFSASIKYEGIKRQYGPTSGGAASCTGIAKSTPHAAIIVALRVTIKGVLLKWLAGGAARYIGEIEKRLTHYCRQADSSCRGNGGRGNGALSRLSAWREVTAIEAINVCGALQN